MGYGILYTYIYIITGLSIFYDVYVIVYIIYIYMCVWYYMLFCRKFSFR